MMDPDLSFSNFGVSPLSRQVLMSQAMTPSRYPDLATAVSPAQLSQTSQESFEVSPTVTLELLRHYRYEVAPWVSLFTILEAR
jgi:hypothetical protein